MSILVGIGVVALLFWIFAAGSRVRHGVGPTNVPADAPLEALQDVVEQLFVAGSEFGFERAWRDQVSGEHERVRRFLRFRRRARLSQLAVGALVAAPFAYIVAPFGQVVPSWVPNLVWYEWALYGLGVLVAYAWFAQLFLPDYARFVRETPGLQPSVGALRAEVQSALRSSLEPMLERHRASVMAANRDQFRAGFARGQQDGRDAGKASGLAEGLARGKQAGYAAGVAATEKAASQQHVDELKQAYERGVADGSAALSSAFDAQILAVRSAAGREGFARGFREGHSKGLADASHRTHDATDPTRGRPRDRHEALAILGLKPDSSREAIESQYTKLRRIVHPDAIRSRGLTSPFVDLADLEFKRLAEARDLLLATE